MVQIVGARTVEHIKDAALSLTVRLTQAEFNEINAMKSNNTVQL
jgi:aryl-alcohol dehydrogenase-like predicted oxidoreductase